MKTSRTVHHPVLGEMVEITLGESEEVRETRRAQMLQEVQENKVLQRQVAQWIGELVGFSWADPVMDEHRTAFLTEDEDDRAHIRAIGADINQVGGFHLMVFVFESMRPMMRHPVDSRTLEFTWDGIGDWRA